MNKACPIIVMGYPRSGTTLIRSRLGSHKEIIMANEPELLFAVRKAGLDLFQEFERTHKTKLFSMREVIKPLDRFLNTLPSSLLDEIIQDSEVNNFKAIYERLLRFQNPNILWGEKSINNCFFIPELLQLYPKVLLVFVIRDPRSTLLSVYKKNILNIELGNTNRIIRRKYSTLQQIQSYSSIALRWSLWNEYILSEFRQVPDKNKFIVKYEEFIENSNEILHSLGEKIGLNLNEKTQKSDSQINHSLLSSNAGVFHKNLLNELDSSRTKSYHELSDILQVVIKRFTDKTALKFGYHLDSKSLNAVDWLKLHYSILLTKKYRKMIENKFFNNKISITN